MTEQKTKILIKFNTNRKNLSFLEVLQNQIKEDKAFLQELDKEFEKVSRKTKNMPLCVKRIHYLIKAELFKK